MSGSFPPTAPAFQLPISGSLPPIAPPAPPIPVKPRRRRKVVRWVLIAVACLLIGTGIGLYIFTRPQPVILVTSQYNVGSVVVGSATSSFHIIGQQFSSNADINFLLDGQAVPISQIVRSDGNGNFQTDLAIPLQWPVGRHTLTARDDQGYVTKAGVPVEIAKPGLDGTPGPNGSPADNASFSLTVAVSATYSDGTPRNVQWPLDILGNPDPAGGKVCAQDDDGQPHTFTGSFNSSASYTETLVLTCSGTYKQGHLTYVETVVSDAYVLNGSVHCATTLPQVGTAIAGDFSSPTQISGTYTRNYRRIDCTDGGYVYWLSATGTWTGTL